MARILPMRDVFVAMFFVSIGMLVKPASLVAELPTVLILVGIVTIGKFVIWSGIVRFAGYKSGTAMLQV